MELLWAFVCSAVLIQRSCYLQLAIQRSCEKLSLTKDQTKASPVALGVTQNWQLFTIIYHCFAHGWNKFCRKALSAQKSPSSAQGALKPWVYSSECSTASPSPGWCVTQAEENEHLKQPREAVNRLFVLKNIFKVCFELPHALNGDQEEHEKGEREQTNPIFWLTAPLSSTVLFSPPCIGKDRKSVV